MKFWKLISLLLLLSTACFAEENTEEVTETKSSENSEESSENEAPIVHEDNDVLVLTKDNFDDVVFDKEIIMVEFYAPWCGHCKALAPAYEAAAKRLKKNNPPISLAKVDATVESSLAERYEVQGYPTIKVFKKGVTTPIDFDGPRDEQGIVDFLRERADPSWKPPPEAVLVLTKDNFTEWTQKEDLMLVMFYAPWCGHCKRFAPEYEKAAQQLVKLDPPVHLMKIDATAETEMATSFKVTGYPTLKIFRKNKVFEYNGPRDTMGVVEYMKKQRGDASKEQKTLKAVKNLMNDDDITIIGFFENEKSKLYERYQEAANHVRDGYTFGHSFEKSIRDHYKVNADSIVVFNAERFYSKYEPKWHVFSDSDAEVEDIKSFFSDHERPLVGVYDTSKGRYSDKTRPLVLFFYTIDFSFEHRRNTQLWRSKILDIAKDFKDLTFAIANEENHENLLKDLGLDDSGEEMNVGIFGEGNLRYPMPSMEEFDSDEIRDFIRAYQAGKLKPKIKSQPIPKKQGIVRTVVGNNFRDIVMDKSKDVLLELYAPWCGHCKAFEPEYKKFAKKLKKEKNLVLAKMDATANESPESGFSAEGFPTIYFAPADRKDSPVKYEGNRDLKDLEDFIKKHASVSFKKDEL